MLGSMVSTPTQTRKQLTGVQSRHVQQKDRETEEDREVSRDGVIVEQTEDRLKFTLE